MAEVTASRVEGLIDEEEIKKQLVQMREEAEETERRCRSLLIHGRARRRRSSTMP